DKNNIDNNTGDLSVNVLADCFERFQNIISKIPALKNAPSQIASYLYHKDFLTFISSNNGNAENLNIINLLLLRRLGKKLVLNPIRLHTYWWAKSDIILTELQLVKLCPSIINELENDISDNFEAFTKNLPEIASQLTLDRVRTISNNTQFEQWQLEASQILILCSELSTGPLSLSLQLLNICNDLVSKQIISYNHLLTVINIGRNNGISDKQFIDYIFDFFNTKGTYLNTVARQNFALRILDIIPLESPTRLRLYERLFEQAQPLPFTAFIVLCIFRLEEKEPFSAIIRNANKVLDFSPRLNVINKQLEKNSCDSQLAALFSDVIQKEIFSNVGFDKLKGLFKDACKALCSPNVKPLQLVCAIALLKQFINRFWPTTLENVLHESFDFNFIHSNKFMVELNDLMQSRHPQVQSLKFYFLKNLRARGLSMNELKQFYNLQKETLPWLSDLPWNKDNDSRLPFNPYSLLDEYEDADDSLSGSQLNSLLMKLSSTSNSNLRIAFVGVIVERFLSINAVRNLNENENEMITDLRLFLESINLSPAYRQLTIRLLANDHPILGIHPKINNKNLLIRLVIIHTLAVHASLPSNYSPLTMYLHKLQDVDNTYILTCPSDEEAILMSALKGFTWYLCVCGFKYVVGECGGTMQSRRCPKCGTTIGGEHHKAAEGQTRLSPGDVQNVITNSDKRGYIMESGSLDQSKSVREMTSSSYRILHLLMHALIAVSPYSQTFLKNISDPIAHCMDHINKDWDVLKTTLNCNDEDLALIIHDILHSMSEDKQFSTPTLSTTQARMTWEGRFTTRYVNNRARNPAAASMDMRNKLQKAKDERKKKTTVFEAEINETLVFDDSYSAKRLPKLWRHIRNASLADFRVFYLNNENFCKHFPFISIYFKYEKLIPHLKHIYHLVKFSRILSMRLNYRIKRNDALNMTFRKFIAEHGELQHSLKAAFDNFAESWNAMMPLIERYQCHDLPTNKPIMNLDCQIVFGLVEGKDAGLFLCAALEYLVDIQNRFLRDVMSIKLGTCHSLKFIENQKGSDANNPYLIKSVRLEDARQANLIDYEWNPKLLKYSQCLLDVGKGKEIIYDLYKIEEELVKDLVFNKTYLEPSEPGGLILEPFYYCMEMFQCSTTILYDIKQKIKQESIPQSMLALLTGGISSNYPSEFSNNAGN
ncbi:9151_t:CDS:2, partial [Racocetra persica]